MKKRKTLLRVSIDIETDKKLSSGDFHDLARWFEEIGLKPLSVRQTRIWRCPKCATEENVGLDYQGTESGVELNEASFEF